MKKIDDFYEIKMNIKKLRRKETVYNTDGPKSFENIVPS